MFKCILNNRIFIAFNQMSIAGLIVQILALILSPILSRIYNSEEFGIFGLFVSYTSLIPVFASFRLELAYFIEKKNIEYFFVSSIVISLVVCIISSSIIYCWSSSDISFILLLTGISTASIFQIFGQLAIAQMKYKKQSISRILQGIVQYSLVLLIGSVYSSKGLILAYILGQFAGIVYLAYIFKFNLSGLNWKQEKKILLENYPFCLNSTITAALQWSVPLAPMFIGKREYGTEMIGIYFLVAQSIQAPFAIIRRSILNIITSELSTVSLFNSAFKPLIKKYYSKVIVLTLIFIIFIFIVTYLYGEQIISFIYGKNWQAGGKFLCYMLVYYIFDLFLQPFSNLLNLWKYYKYSYLIQIILFLSIYSLAFIVELCILILAFTYVYIIVL